MKSRAVVGGSSSTLSTEGEIEEASG